MDIQDPSLPARGVRKPLAGWLRDPRLLPASGVLLLVMAAALLHHPLTLILASSGGLCLGLAWQRRARGSHQLAHGALLESVNPAAAQQIELQARERRLLLERLDIAGEKARLGILDWDLLSGQLAVAGDITRQFALPSGGSADGLQLLEKMVHPEDWQPLHQAITAALTASDSLEHDYRCLLPDGTIQHAQLRGKIFRDAAGKPERLLGVAIDTTRVVEAAAEIERQAQLERKLVERLSMATQTANICSWEVDIQGHRFLWVDNPIKTVSGVQDISGPMDTWEARVHPDDLRDSNALVRAAIAAGRERLSWRYRDVSPEGRVCYVQVHARLIYSLDQMPRLLGVSWDVTPEVHAAAALQRQAQQLQAAQRRLERASLSSLEGHWETDIAALRVWFSDSCHTLLGYPQGHLPAAVAAAEHLFHPEDMQQVRQAFIAHYKTSAPFYVDARMRTASGAYRWYRHRGTAGRDAAGRAVSMAGSMQDIHTQKLTEDALHLAQQRFERAIKGTQDGLWELQSNGGAWCSPRLLELLGYAGDELPSDTHFLNDFLHPGDVDAVTAATNAHFEHGTAYDVEIRLRTKSGAYGWYRARATAERDGRGQPVRLSGSLQDITEARRARQALILATEAAEAASRAKSEFLANVSHEIRTPMNGILGMTTLLLETPLDATQRNYASTIRSSADSLHAVMSDILDFSKIEAGKLQIEALDFDLRHEIEAVAVSVAPQALLKNLELILDVHADVPRRVLGDPQRLRQCLLNLLANALKFTAGGEITVAVRLLAADPDGRSDGQHQVRFEVRDTGIGIAAATLATLFQPFVQADSSITRHFGGTGLGLSIVRRLVELMGGEVGVTSELGRGSAFWFRVPLQRSAQPQSDELVLTRVARRVLVIEPNAAQRAAITRQLGAAGYGSAGVSSTSAALSCLQQACAAGRAFDAVLVRYDADAPDTHLPAQLRSDARLAHIRTIALTTMDQQSDPQRLADLGYCAHLCKPIRHRELLGCVDRALGDSLPQAQAGGAPLEQQYAAYVLLAEDNPVNQTVALRFLERVGCRVRVVCNGSEAVQAHGEEAFDLVLMDLQMPIMDGITATRLIRASEGRERRTPIFALTANAMPGQEGRCLEAGMDGFITKPLHLDSLRAMLDRLELRYDPRAAAQVPQTQRLESARVPIDLARLNELTDGDVEFTRELAGTFLRSGEQTLAAMRAALAGLDRIALGRAAHKLKGAGANIHAQLLCELAQELEQRSGSLEPEACVELLDRLAEELQRAAGFLNAQLPADLADTAQLV